MLRFGPVEIEMPVIQAALSGYSDAAMRMIARRHGAAYCIHEVVLDKVILHSAKLRKEAFFLPEGDHPVGGQLMGSEPEDFGVAAGMLAEAGFDVIDINFGCPVRKVLGRCRGGYLLSDPPTAIEIIRRVRDAVPAGKPVTIKMRRGMDDSLESERNFFTIFDAAVSLGVAGIAVHGRTVQQKYVGSSRWEFLKRVKRHAGDFTVLGSGDVFTAEAAVRMIESTGVDGVWAARGCIGNPWIFRESRALLAGQPLPEMPSVAEQGEVIRAHYELAASFEGEKAAKTMRKFGIKYARMHPFPGPVRSAFVSCQNAADWMRTLDEWYDPAREWPVPQRRIDESDLMAAGAEF